VRAIDCIRADISLSKNFSFASMIIIFLSIFPFFDTESISSTIIIHSLFSNGVERMVDI
jgi:hypothetical protein